MYVNAFSLISRDVPPQYRWGWGQPCCGGGARRNALHRPPPVKTALAPTTIRLSVCLAPTTPGGPAARREFSLAAASLADSVGVALADVCGVLIQGCLFKANGIPGADFAC